MSSANFSKGPDGDLIYYPKACKTEPISKGDKTKWLEVKHEVKDYKPEEIKIKVSKNLGKIEGNHKTKFASKSFYKEFIIPQGVDIKQLDISLSANGILSIFAAIGNGLNASGTGAIHMTTQSQDSVQSKSKRDESKVSQIESNRGVSRTTETTRKIKQVNVAEFSSDELNNSRIEDISKEIRKVEQGSSTKKFETRINVKEYSAENLQVKISTQMVIVTGKIVTESTRKEFIKKFSIPSGVEPGSITNSLDTTTGILTISAPINETQNYQIRTRDADATQKITTTNLQQLCNTQQQQVTGQEQIQQRREVTQRQQQQVSQRQQQQVNQTQQQVSQTQQQISQTQQQISQTQQQVTSSSIQSSSTSTVTRTTATSERIIERECTLNSTLDLNNQLQAISDSVCENVSNECVVRDGDSLEVNIELPNFAPEDIGIRVTKTTVIINAKREIREQNRVSIEEISKKFTIPFGIRPEDITSILQTNGVLRITNSKTSTTTTTQQQTLTNEGQNATPTPVSSPYSPNTPAFSQRPNENVGKVKPTVDLTTEVDNKKLTSYEDLTNTIREDEDGNNIEVNLNVSDFKRDEVNVKIYKRIVIIEARKKTTTTTTKTLLKKLTIPDGVRPEQISCDIKPSGILSITAPVEKVQQPIEDITDSEIPTVQSTVEITEETDVEQEDLKKQVDRSKNLVQTRTRDTVESTTTTSTDEYTTNQQTTTQTQPESSPRPAPESLAPKTRAPEGRVPEGRVPEGRVPEGRVPEGRVPEGRVPEGQVPEGRVPEGRVPEGQVPEGRVPEGRVPEGRVPEGQVQEGRLPEGRVSEERVPEAVKPQTIKPEERALEERAPKERAPKELETEALQPEALQPEVLKPEALKPETIKPETIIPGTVKPATLKPEERGPEKRGPEERGPEERGPDELKPEALKPVVPKLETIKPGTLAPETLESEELKPDSLKPEALEPNSLNPATVAPEAIKPVTPASGVRAPDSPVSKLPRRPIEDVGKVEPTVDFTTEINNEELTSHEDLTNVHSSKG